MSLGGDLPRCGGGVLDLGNSGSGFPSPGGGVGGVGCEAFGFGGGVDLLRSSLDRSLIIGLSFGFDDDGVSVERLSPPSLVEAEPGVGVSPGGATVG